mmetsp:Transcript_34980/g.80549  ORF Transcript_34980/g.80549 Transcript_34980/m.80549 type:complete len:330 (+) Transcript_34980:44-1033(+)
MSALQNEDPPAECQVDVSSLWPGTEGGSCKAEVTREEIGWMLARRPLLPVTQESLAHDYNAEEARKMVQAFTDAGMSHLLPVLRWPGVGTRWREFVRWEGAKAAATPEHALGGFACALGRVTTYRALSLDAAGLQRILEAKEIFPRGQLDVSPEKLGEIIEVHGVAKVVVARLYIAHLKRLIGHDPSISLHDDWQTTSCIASGYTSPDKAIYLFEISVPIVESLGLRLNEVEVNAAPILGPRYGPSTEGWFCFEAPAFPDGVHFDRTIQRTERYGLYSVPFLHQRLRRLWKFPSASAVGRAIAPFAQRQAEMRRCRPEGYGPPPYAEVG